MKILSDLDVSGKKVFLRADLDVPILHTANSSQLTAESGKQTAEVATRLTNLKPTVEYLLEYGAQQIFIAGHVGRPKQLIVNSSQFTGNTEADKPEFYDPALSTNQLLEPLEKILGQKISLVPDLSIQSKPGLEQVDKPGLSGNGEVFLLENLRFWPGETANDIDFAKQLALMADIYVNDAFGNCHRPHASMVGVPALFPDVAGSDGVYFRRAAGLHLEEEVRVLSKLLKNPERPFVAIVGGAKLETKIPVIENLAKIADWVLVGGEIAKEIASGRQLTADSNKLLAVSGEHLMIATLTPDTEDIDQESINKFKSIIKTAKTVVWNGPMGIFEEGFEKGTVEVANAIIDSGAYAVVGGGETTQFLASKNLLSPPAGGFSFVSSGGGAMLEFLSGKKLPGIVALE